jgi:hypothetical protein
MHQLWLNPNQWFFGKDGDGLQTYYQSQWHVKYDSTCWHQTSMNYPYGESIFFTGGQPLISNLIVLVKPLIDLSDYTVGITNSVMLLSPLLCAAFLYLIFKRLQLRPWMAVAAAVLITFTAQQWHRMLGHYSLAWLFAIPGMLYLLMWFYEKRTTLRSVCIMLYMLFLCFGHIYYIVFFAVLAVSFFIPHAWLAPRREKLRLLGQLILQVAGPFIILQLFVAASTDVSDRTSLPWGFMVFRSSWPSYLYPFAVWYESYFPVRPKTYIETEGLSYIGIAGYIMIFTLAIASAYHLLKKKFSHFHLQPNVLAMLISTVAAIIISFAFPFNLGHEDWLRYTGPLQQFRGIGRFAFVSFFPMSIFLMQRFTGLSWMQGITGKLIFGLMVLLGLKEGTDRVQGFARDISNERGEVLRGEAHLPAELKTKRYQAILPMPFFHVGSENIWLADESGLSAIVFDVSYGLRLPTFAALMSRTSIAQTFSTVALSRTLMEYPAVLNELPSDDPFLVLADTSKLNENEARLLRHATFLCTHRSRQCYELPVQAFSEVMKELKSERPETPYRQDAYCMVSDSAAEVVYIPTDTTFILDDAWKRLAVSEIPAEWRGKTIKISFWIGDFVRDLIPRTTIEITQFRDKNVTGFDAEIPGKRIVGLYRGDALVEYSLEIDAETERIEILGRNKMLPGKKLRAFSFLMRPDNVNCTILRNGTESINNRLQD